MQLINLETLKRTVLASEQARQLLVAIADGRLCLDLEESLDLDGDLVLEDAEYGECLEWLRRIKEPSSPGS